MTSLEREREIRLVQVNYVHMSILNDKLDLASILDDCKSSLTLA